MSECFNQVTTNSLSSEKIFSCVFILFVKNLSDNFSISTFSSSKTFCDLVFHTFVLNEKMNKKSKIKFKGLFSIILFNFLSKLSFNDFTFSCDCQQIVQVFSKFMRHFIVIGPENYYWQMPQKFQNAY